MKLKTPLTFSALVAALAFAIVLAAGIGAVAVPPLTFLRMILYGIGVHSVGLPAPIDVTIIVMLRLPRIAAALLVGSALAMCGAVMQGLFRNPMASPEVLGISAGGSLGAVIAITSGLGSASLFSLPLLTVVGALFAAAVIYWIASLKGATSLLFVVLAGMAVSSLLGGITSALLFFSREQEVSRFLFWTMGGLDGRTWRHVLLAAPVLIPGMAGLALFSRELNVFSLGEQSAASLGMSVENTKRALLALSAVVTGTAIAVSGPVGFIGLLIPHFFRLILGPDHRTLLPASALGGGLFLIASDLVGRAIAPPFEIRVGIITAILGSPYLLFLVVRSQKRRAAPQ